VNGDGCCPSTCSGFNDSDCPAIDCTNDSTWPATWVAFEDEVVRLVNQNRTAGATCGTTVFPAQPALTFNAKIRQAARCHSLDMALNSLNSHTGSDGSDGGQRMTRAGYDWYWWGENVAWGWSTAGGAVGFWMGSESHCRNVMSSNFVETGVGYVRLSCSGCSTESKWTQNFGSTR
jgi:uncharacterized protein YkwD